MSSDDDEDMPQRQRYSKKRSFGDDDDDDESEEDRGWTTKLPPSFVSSRGSGGNKPNSKASGAGGRRNKNGGGGDKPNGFAEFTKHTTGFGLKMMLKMGYKPGKGLGNDGSGLVNPIDVKLRPAKMGLGHKGFDEKTETVKEEMRRQRERNGDEHGSSGEESTDGNVGGKNNKRNVWKQQDDAGGGQHQQQHQRKPAARKHTYKTAAQLIAEQEQQAETAAGTASTSSVPSTILDMTGEEVRILTSASQISTNSMQMVQHARLPELRHNLMLIMDMAQTELVSAAKSTALEKRRVEDNEIGIKQVERVLQAVGDEVEVLERVLELCSKIVVSLAKVAGDEKTATAAVRKLSLSSSSLLLHPDNAAATPSSKFDTIFSSLLNQPDVVPILTLLAESTELYSAYRNHFLDNLLVSIVSPVFKSLTQLWDPLSEPRFACQWLKTHRRLLVLDEVDWYSSSLQEDDIMDIDEDNGPLVPSFGSRTRHYRRSGTAPSPSTASPYESLLYNIWLPRIRSALNNRWVVVNPDPAIALIDSWHPTTEYTHHEKGPFGEGSKIHGELPNLPAFASQKCLMPYWMYLNIVDQIILPKLSSYILQVWDPRELIGIRGGGGGISPHTWIHPWLPYIDAQRIDAHVFTHLRYKLGMLFRQLSNMNSTRSSTSTQPITSASTGLLSLVLPYKDVWSSETMNTFISKSVLPFLAALLRRELNIDPAAQDLSPLLEGVIPWMDQPTSPGILSPQMIGELLRMEFFPKWHAVLWHWLRTTTANSSAAASAFEEISEWYNAWKTVMRDAGLAKIDAVRHGLRIALEAMSAVEEDGPATLPSLETPQPLSDKQQIDARPAQNSAKSLSKNFVTFRDLVERTISAAGGWMQALGRSHPTSGKALFKVSASAGVSSGVLVYLDEGVLFFEDPEQGGQWRPIGLEDVLQKIRSK